MHTYKHTDQQICKYTYLYVYMIYTKRIHIYLHRAHAPHLAGENIKNWPTSNIYIYTYINTEKIGTTCIYTHTHTYMYKQI